MKILHVNTNSSGGGAAQLARDLVIATRHAGHDALLAVGRRDDTFSSAYTIGECWEDLGPQVSGRRLCLGERIVNRGGRRCARSGALVRNLLGHEDFEFPRSRRLLDELAEAPDIVHLHNLHGGYFDLRFLSTLTKRVPCVITLHDAWLLSGHCAHSFECKKWRSGCGECPDLSIYPAVRRDATRYNWHRKREIYSRISLHVVSPCNWLMERVGQSILAQGIASATVIPHGVDADIFKISDKQMARRELGLPSDATIVIFSAKGVRDNRWKDFATLKNAIDIVAQENRKSNILLVALGDDGAVASDAHTPILFVPYVKDRNLVAKYYQASDVYVHAAKAELWGLSITEAMACGLPVVATGVGGIPEQLSEGKTAFIVSPGDSADMAAKIKLLVQDDAMRERMGQSASKNVLAQFSLRKMTSEYLRLYQRILSRQPS